MLGKIQNKRIIMDQIQDQDLDLDLDRDQDQV